MQIKRTESDNPVLSPEQFAGAAIGVRGGIPTRVGSFSYDPFMGTPVYAPPGFPAASMTPGFQFAGQF